MQFSLSPKEDAPLNGRDDFEDDFLFNPSKERPDDEILKDEELFEKDSIKPGQLPKINKDLKIIVANTDTDEAMKRRMEEKPPVINEGTSVKPVPNAVRVAVEDINSTIQTIQRLKAILENIQQAGGMCKSFAIDINEVEDSLIKQSLNYFSDNPSLILYEEVSNKLKNRINELENDLETADVISIETIQNNALDLIVKTPIVMSGVFKTLNMLKQTFNEKRQLAAQHLSQFHEEGVVPRYYLNKVFLKDNRLDMELHLDLVKWLNETLYVKSDIVVEAIQSLPKDTDKAKVELEMIELPIFKLSKRKDQIKLKEIQDLHCTVSKKAKLFGEAVEDQTSNLTNDIQTWFTSLEKQIDILTENFSNINEEITALAEKNKEVLKMLIRQYNLFSKDYLGGNIQLDEHKENNLRTIVAITYELSMLLKMTYEALDVFNHFAEII